MFDVNLGRKNAENRVSAMSDALSDQCRNTRYASAQSKNVSGIDVIRAVRQACGSDIPAVVITGDTSVDSIGRHRLHADAHIQQIRSALDDR